MTLATIPLVLMLLGVATAADGAGSEMRLGNCPAETEQARRMALRYATSDEFAPIRERNGVPTAAEAGVRLLVDETDRDLCQRITATVQRRNQHGTAGYRPVYYAAGDHYFVALSRERRKPAPAPPGHVTVSLGGWVPFYVLDRGLNIVASVAM